MTAERTIKRQFNIEISPSDEDFCDLFKALEHDEIAKESVIEVLKEKNPVKNILHKFRVLSDSELEHKLNAFVESNKEFPPSVIMGKALSELRGKVSGQKIVDWFRKRFGDKIFERPPKK
jgi:Glu-tRNA(Gln) amidotransferase subunit E-like FAD-binding protein